MDFRRALIEEQVATPEEVERASARQVLYGGDLITNLLDARAIDEKGAARALCRAHALAPAPLGELPYGSAQAIELLPRDTASSLGIYPYRLDGDTFTVIAGQPLATSEASALSETLGVKIRVLLALTPRVRQALARDYAQPLESRVQKALARLEGKVPPNTIPASPLLDGPSFSKLPQPPSIAPLRFPRLWDDGDTPTEAQLSAETAPAPPVAPNYSAMSKRNPVHATRPAAVHTPVWTEPGTSQEVNAVAPAPPAMTRGRRPRHRGPYTAHEATKDLAEASDVDELLPIYFDYAAQYFDRCALFTLHRTGVQLREHRGIGSVAADGSEHGLSAHPALQEVSRSGRWLLTTLAETDPHLHSLLAARGNAQWLLLPIRVRGRVALILVGGFDDSDVNLVDTGDLLAFEPAMSQALQRAIVARKRERNAETGRSGAEQPAVHAAGQASLIPKRSPSPDGGQSAQHQSAQHQSAQHQVGASTPPMPVALGAENALPGGGTSVTGLSGPRQRS